MKKREGGNLDFENADFTCVDDMTEMKCQSRTREECAEQRETQGMNPLGVFDADFELNHFSGAAYCVAHLR